MLCGISSRFQLLSPTEGQVAHALLTRSPLSHNLKQASSCASFDLHVLGMPPAFILSQDQTLNKLYLKQHLCCIKIDLLKFNLFQNKSQNRILFYSRCSKRLLKEPFYFWCLKALLAFLTLFNFQGTGRLATVFIRYHKPFQLSRTFFKFFKLFCSRLRHL